MQKWIIHSIEVTKTQKIRVWAFRQHFVWPHSLEACRGLWVQHALLVFQYFIQPIFLFTCEWKLLFHHVACSSANHQPHASMHTMSNVLDTDIPTLYKFVNPTLFFFVVVTVSVRSLIQLNGHFRDLLVVVWSTEIYWKVSVTSVRAT